MQRGILIRIVYSSLLFRACTYVRTWIHVVSSSRNAIVHFYCHRWLLVPRICCCHRLVEFKPRHYSNHRTDSSPRVDSRAFWSQVARRGMEVGTSRTLKRLSKNEQYHPLRVYNSPCVAEYIKKRVNTKNLYIPAS